MIVYDSFMMVLWAVAVPRQVLEALEGHKEHLGAAFSGGTTSEALGGEVGDGVEGAEPVAGAQRESQAELFRRRLSTGLWAPF